MIFSKRKELSANTDNNIPLKKREKKTNRFLGNRTHSKTCKLQGAYVLIAPTVAWRSVLDPDATHGQL